MFLAIILAVAIVFVAANVLAHGAFFAILDAWLLRRWDAFTRACLAVRHALVCRRKNGLQWFNTPGHVFGRCERCGYLSKGWALK